MSFERPITPSLADTAAVRLDDIRSDVEQQALVSEPMALGMAYAEKPFMDELVESGRNITIDRMLRLARLAERAGLKVEQAYRDGTEYSQSNVPDSMPTRSAAPVELIKPAHPVLEQLNKNLTELEYRAKAILIGLRVPGTNQYIKTERMLFQDCGDAYARFEDVDLYDPSSGSLIHIQLITQEMPGKEDRTFHWSINDVYVPAEDTKPGQRKVTRGLSYSRDIREEDRTYLTDCKGIRVHDTLQDDDPQLIQNWFTRLAGGIPVTKDEIEQLFRKQKKEVSLTGEYRGRTINLSSDKLENTDSRQGRKLLETLYERRALIDGATSTVSVLP